MKFPADENFPDRSIFLLREHDIDITSIREIAPGTSDRKVLKMVNDENRTLLTLDSDFGTLIFKSGLKSEAGVIFFRLVDFTPSDLSEILLELIERNESFEKSLIVIDKNSIRKRKFH